MSLRINQNIDALNSYRNLSVTQGQMSKSLEKLSSGYRINRAADDAAGLAISEGLRSQVGGIKVAVRNAQDGVSVVQTAEGALTETHSILQRMRDLAVQSANDSNDVDSRKAIDAETTALKDELNRIADKTTFNNIKLLDGSFTDKLFQVGYAANDTIEIDIQSAGASAAKSTWANGAAAATAAAATFTQNGVTVTTAALTASTDANDIADQLNNDTNFKAAFTARVGDDGGLVVESKTGLAGAITAGGGLNAAGTNDAAGASGGGFGAIALGVNGVDLKTQTGANAAITSIDSAIKAVSTSRANLGALQNRFEHTINNLNVTQENLSASESRIRDTDMASEMMNFTRSQILSQAGTAMLAQANQAPQGVLSLLR
ncbi:flagellin [Nocardioides sp. YIM 152315]|uniref:flagellin N-terminal helical domain-containing protein n=1 Tax=Nocardioides sp. YIM 152315 TaxID=3031760 RepID=UPI0023DC3E52|nr:flagellin [Nocardioides sp. YIM 152315]MDF1605955.1 flagellin [Nocardioides sp. YIM 152315]